MRQLDGKFHIEGETIEAYHELCKADGCTDYQIRAIELAWERFTRFSIEHDDRMKQPGITKGL